MAKATPPKTDGSSAGNGKSKVTEGGKPTASAAPPVMPPVTQPVMPDDETLKKLAPHIAKVRAHVRESFGKVVMTMMMLPRFRNQTVADLQHLAINGRHLKCSARLPAFPRRV